MCWWCCQLLQTTYWPFHCLPALLQQLRTSHSYISLYKSLIILKWQILYHQLQGSYNSKTANKTVNCKITFFVSQTYQKWPPIKKTGTTTSRLNSKHCPKIQHLAQYFICIQWATDTIKKIPAVLCLFLSVEGNKHSLLLASLHIMHNFIVISLLLETSLIPSRRTSCSYATVSTPN